MLVVVVVWVMYAAMLGATFARRRAERWLTVLALPAALMVAAWDNPAGDVPRYLLSTYLVVVAVVAIPGLVPAAYDVTLEVRAMIVAVVQRVRAWAR